MEEKDPDIVIVGAGPVGLFLAIQIVLRNPTLKVVMMEKYAEYKRKHVLRIEKESLATGINDPRLVKLVSELKGKTPTSLIEENFKALAGEIGISIRVGEYVKDIEALQKRFHNTRYFIGADGRKSVMRTQKFGDNLCLNYNVMKVAFCKYRVEGETSPFHWTRYISLVHDSNHTIYELIGKPKDGVTSVTLQIFVSSEELEKMSRFNFKDPAKIADLESVCPKLAESLNIWLKARKLEMKEKRIDEPKINPVPLDLYQSTDVVKRENGVTYAIVGDAAFGLPFFRALNDGLLCATKLSKAIVEDLSRRPQEKIRINNGQGKKKRKKSISSISSASTNQESDPMEEYSAFFKRLAWWEKQKVNSKAMMIGSSVNTVKVSRKVKQKSVRSKQRASSVQKRYLRVKARRDRQRAEEEEEKVVADEISSVYCELM